MAIKEIKKEIIKFCLDNKEELHGYTVMKTLLNHGLFEESLIFAQESKFSPALFRNFLITQDYTQCIQQVGNIPNMQERYSVLLQHASMFFFKDPESMMELLTKGPFEQLNVDSLVPAMLETELAAIRRLRIFIRDNYITGSKKTNSSGIYNLLFNFFVYEDFEIITQEGRVQEHEALLIEYLQNLDKKVQSFSTHQSGSVSGVRQQSSRRSFRLIGARASPLNVPAAIRYT